LGDDRSRSRSRCLVLVAIGLGHVGAVQLLLVLGHAVVGGDVGGRSQSGGGEGDQSDAHEGFHLGCWWLKIELEADGSWLGCW